MKQTFLNLTQTYWWELTKTTMWYSAKTNEITIHDIVDVFSKNEMWEFLCNNEESISKNFNENSEQIRYAFAI